MTKEELQQSLSKLFPGLTFPEINSKILNAECPREMIRDVAGRVKADEALQLDFLFCQTAIDWPENLEVIYHLRSSVHGHEVVLRVRTEGRDNPKVDTVSDIFRTAEFHEREIYDLFGVVFNNHPDLRRLLLEDDRIGHPLLKDYVDDVNIIEL